MNGETNLATLLASMKPRLNEGQYVFCSLNDNSATIDSGEILCSFRENEGLTIILKKETAEKLGLEYHFIASWITLSVHSSLAAVGLTAAFSKALADKGISCNIVSAFYHDHLFVRVDDTDKVMQTLRRLSVTF